jgi:regulator of PEP synthase PpsR (kinase-PPPase family)
VIGLTVEPGQLLQYRQRRQRLLGAPGASAYADPQAIFEELQQALEIFRRSGFTVIDMTDKTIELGADEIIRHLS